MNISCYRVSSSGFGDRLRPKYRHSVDQDVLILVHVSESFQLHLINILANLYGHTSANKFTKQL